MNVEGQMLVPQAQRGRRMLLHYSSIVLNGSTSPLSATTGLTKTRVVQLPLPALMTKLKGFAGIANRSTRSRPVGTRLTESHQQKVVETRLDHFNTPSLAHKLRTQKTPPLQRNACFLAIALR